MRREWLQLTVILLITLFSLTTVSHLFSDEHIIFTPTGGDYISVNGREDNLPAFLTGSDTPLGFQVKRFQEVAISPNIRNEGSISEGETVVLNLFADTIYKGFIDHVSTDINNTTTVRIRLQDHPFGYMLISTSADRSLAVIRIPELQEFYKIIGSPGTNVHYLFDIGEENRNYLESGPPLTVKETGESYENRNERDNRDSNNHNDTYRNPGPNDPATIDVMVVYTPAAQNWANQQGGGINNVVAQTVALSQLAHDNSGTIVTLRLAHSSLIQYTESGNSVTDLYRLTFSENWDPWGDEGGPPWYMEEVHEWRDEHRADLVGFLTLANDTGGLGWQLNTTLGEPRLGFSLTRVQQAANTYTFVHELGHNMGTHHHRNQNFQPGPGLYNYAAGWRWTGTDNNRYCSVMSYESGEYFQDGLNHSRVGYFSNPAINYQGTATGHTTLGDNSRTIREIKHVIAEYRGNRQLIDEYPWSESFENATFPPTGWSRGTVVGTTQWIRASGGYLDNPNGAAQGSWNARFYGGANRGHSGYLITPEFDLSLITDAQLNFSHAQAVWQGDQDILNVFFSSSLDGPWTRAANYTADTPAWANRNINIPNTYDRLFVKFEAVSDYGYGVVIDNIRVDGDPIPQGITDYPWSESFENAAFPPEGWVRGALVGTTDWIRASGGHSGYPNGAAHGQWNALFYGAANRGHSGFLITPQFDLSPITNRRLLFSHAQREWLGDQDVLNVYYGSSLNGPWQRIANYTQSIANWTNRSIVLPDSLTSIYIRFEAISDYGYGVVLDNVRVEGDPLANNPAVAINPYPVNDSVGVGINLNALRWDYPANEDFAQPAGFRVYFNTTGQFGANDDYEWVAYDEEEETFACSDILPALQMGTRYYWKVVPTTIEPDRRGDNSPRRNTRRDAYVRAIHELPLQERGDAVNVPVWTFRTEVPLVRVTGRITGNDLPDGIAGAAITLSNQQNSYQLQSGENGNFTINNVEGSATGTEYELRVTSDGYQVHTSQRFAGTNPLNLGIIRLNEEAWAPRNLTASPRADGNAINLEWTAAAPTQGTEQWLHWDTGTNHQSIGNGGVVQFIVAARYTPAQLAEADAIGLHINAIRFYPRTAGATYTIRVYRGGSADPLSPGVLVTSQAATNVVVNQWNLVNLTTPVEILPDQELWFGYHINTQTGHPAGCDAGPAINYSGNIIYWDNSWTTLLNLQAGLNYNWNVQAYAAALNRGEPSRLLAPVSASSFEQHDTSFNITRTSPQADPMLSNITNDDSGYSARTRRINPRNTNPMHLRELEGYRIFRFHTADLEDFDRWVYLHTVANITYSDLLWQNLDSGTYRYAVQAEYTNEVYSDFILSNAVTKEFQGGTGTEQQPWLIASADQLNNVRNYLGAAHTTKYFRQIADIDLNIAPYNQGEGWVPIGNETTQFYGKYDGNGYTISGLLTNRPTTFDQGLFGFLSGSSITNLGVINANVTGGSYVGILAAYLTNSTVSNCFSTGTVRGTSYVGGLIGSIDNSQLRNSFSRAQVNGGTNFGGLIGTVGTNANMLNCYSTGQVVTIAGGTGANAGGLAGILSGTASGCYWDRITSGRTTSAGAISRTTTEMTFPYNPNTYLNWDFANIWRPDTGGNLNNGYPVLSNFVSGNPNIASNPVPADDSSRVAVTLGNLQWSYTPDQAYSIPAGFRVYFNTTGEFGEDDDFEWVPYDAQEENFTTAELLPERLNYNTAYYWQVIPTTIIPEDDGRGNDDSSRRRRDFYVRAIHEVPLQMRGDAQDCPVWTFTTADVFVTEFPWSESFEESIFWQTANEGQANAWHIGTAVANTGNRSAYISNDGGNSHSYNINTASVSHIYRNLSFPEDASAFWLSFMWKGTGEGTTPRFYDFMEVHLIDYDVTPVAGEPIDVDALQGVFNMQDDWTREVIRLDGEEYAGSTKRLVFTWINDNRFGSQPPVAIDDISIIKIRNQPAIASNPYPVQDSIDVAADLESLRWHYHADSTYAQPVGFRVYFASSADFDEDEFVWVPYDTEETVFSTADAFPQELSYYADYFWKVVPTTVAPDDGRSNGRARRAKNVRAVHELPLQNRHDATDTPVWNFRTERYPNPVVTINPYPPNDSIGVTVLLDNLSWEYHPDSTAVDPAGFRLYFDTHDDFDDDMFVWIAYQQDRQEYNNNELLGNLTANTTYYWKVVPTTIVPDDDGRGNSRERRVKNVRAIRELPLQERGDAANVPIWSFTTLSTVPFTESFSQGHNNWIFSDEHQTNKWNIGSAVAYQGENSVYVSNDGGTNNRYTTNAASVSHIYRDICFPDYPLGFSLSFQWKGLGEGFEDEHYDFMKVYLTDTAVVPAAGEQITVGNIGSIYNLQANWQEEQIELPAADFSGTTKRLVFSWVNDNMRGMQPPLAVDNIRIEKTTLAIPVVSISIAAGMIHLSWEHIPSANAYRIMVSDSITYNDDDWTELAVVDENHFEEELTPAATRFFRVIAFIDHDAR